MPAPSGGPGWKQPCLRPRLGIPPCRSSGGGWKTRFISPWQDGILLPIPASGARNDRSGLLELLDLVVEGDTLVVTHIDRLSRGLTHGLQVIEGLHRAGVEFRSMSEDIDTATATGKLQLTMVLAFSEWWRNSIRERSVAGQAKARAEGRFVSSTNCYIDNRRLKKQGCHRAW